MTTTLRCSECLESIPSIRLEAIPQALTRSRKYSGERWRRKHAENNRAWRAQKWRDQGGDP